MIKNVGVEKLAEGGFVLLSSLAPQSFLSQFARSWRVSLKAVQKASEGNECQHSAAGWNRLIVDVISRGAVEKPLPAKFAKIKLHQDAVQTTFSVFLDIFYPQNFGYFEENGLFQHPLPISLINGKSKQFCSRSLGQSLAAESCGSCLRRGQACRHLTEDLLVVSGYRPLHLNTSTLYARFLRQSMELTLKKDFQLLRRQDSNGNSRGLAGLGLDPDAVWGFGLLRF
jgi:hypothetical protein